MARLALNKSSLSHQSKQLDRYREYLPALDLKRRQLMMELNKARRALAELEKKLADFTPRVAETLPMLANEHVEVKGIAQVAEVFTEQENIMGTWLPKVTDVRIEVRDYALLGKPHWVDRLVVYLRQALRLKVEIEIAKRRVALLAQAVRTITQRVNLFDKVLIPKTIANIKKIRIYLSDAERAAVVTAKIAKQKKS
ncbi:V-type ATP synthase subunit D [Candidatus Venteria ishoeyi]|uniref:V-type ATP synthase subunit D n=1 Tax=Candidatus Venteria ishoeyi TaxID=1899563 RepID=A0A1H6F670_9GAMM|nr:V-type ATP synthase subunit D [Candidatus Venteria ishoeyi]MDM8547518.1 V-type ATP synthase subunit D [Candidatus Venteria ishoeyi]SEH05668.1 V-type ATP synthase subunit D [Candidatus Venteria ishoeyi]